MTFSFYSFYCHVFVIEGMDSRLTLWGGKSSVEETLKNTLEISCGYRLEKVPVMIRLGSC